MKMKIEATNVINEINAIRTLVKILLCTKYYLDEDICDLLYTVLLALEYIETAYRKEKENDKQTNSERI